MARFDGEAAIRRVISTQSGQAMLDVRPDGQDWMWTFVPADRAREAIACGLTAISGGWKMYLTLPDDATSFTLESFGISKTPG
jgi:hypothetical protein